MRTTFFFTNIFSSTNHTWYYISMVCFCHTVISSLSNNESFKLNWNNINTNYIIAKYDENKRKKWTNDTANDHDDHIRYNVAGLVVDITYSYKEKVSSSDFYIQMYLCQRNIQIEIFQYFEWMNASDRNSATVCKWSAFFWIIFEVYLMIHNVQYKII